MKISFFLVLLFLTFGTHIKAQLVFQNDVIEYYPDISAKEIVAAFPFKNTGKTTITIKEVKPSCGCTVASIDRMIYAPNETGILKATYTIHGATGIQEKKIAVLTVQSPNDIKILTIKAYLPEIVKILSPTLFWNTGDVPLPKNVRFSVIYEKQVKLLDIDWSTNKVIAKISSNNKDTYQITVTPLSTDEPFEGSVWVKLLLPGNVLKTVYIPFSIKLKK